MTTIVTQLGGQDVEVWAGPDAIEWAYPSALEPLGLDVETTWMGDRGQFDPEFRVRTVQIATKRTAAVFDLTDPAQRERISEILADPAYTFCSHTNMDVLSVWREFGIDIAERNVDTHMLAVMADPDAENDRDLKTLATRHGMPELASAERSKDDLFLRMWKDSGGKGNAKRADIQKHGWENVDLSEERFLIYAALDAVACRRLADILTPATQNPPELLRVDQWLHVQANHLQMAGKRVDYPRLTEALAEARQITGDAKSKAQELTGGVNIHGPKIIDWLAEHGADWSAWEARTDGGAPSLAKEHMLELRDLPLDDVGRQVAELMIEYQSRADLLKKTEDVAKRVVWETDHPPRRVVMGLDQDAHEFEQWDERVPRIHPTLHPLGAKTTGRMSAAEPNMQNFSKKDPRMRGLFLPEEGHVLATIDFDQIELRVVAALAREDSMIETIRAGGDLHQLTVDLLHDGYGIDISRDTAKMTNFLIVYGGGGKALHEQGGIPLDLAWEIVKAQRASYPSISALSQYLGQEREALRTISHRRIPITRNKKTGEIRSYANINYVVQSAARELLVDAWMWLDERRPGVVWWPVHDELILQAPEDEMDDVLAVAETAMRFDFRGVPISATGIVLRDEQGVSRWMTAKLAEKIQRERVPV